jgi:predicted nucleic-acid-binding protein
MLAVDTNVVVRYLVRDDEAQSARAGEIIAGGGVFVSVTVILECEWVLRSLYGFALPEVVRALKGFCGTPGVSVGNAPAVYRALDLAALGLDFADALHLAQAGECEAFLTFDKRLARKAKGFVDFPVRLARN